MGDINFLWQDHSAYDEDTAIKVADLNPDKFIMNIVLVGGNPSQLHHLLLVLPDYRGRKSICLQQTIRKGKKNNLLWAPNLFALGKPLQTSGGSATKLNLPTTRTI